MTDRISEERLAKFKESPITEREGELLDAIYAERKHSKDAESTRDQAINALTPTLQVSDQLSDRIEKLEDEIEYLKRVADQMQKLSGYYLFTDKDGNPQIGYCEGCYTDVANEPELGRFLREQDGNDL